MKTPRILKLHGAFLAAGVTIASNASSNATENPNVLERAAHVSEEINVDIGQGTNIVTVRLVQWFDARGLEHKVYVFHAKTTKQMITADATNQVCYFRGKLITVAPGLQSFTVASSEVVGSEELTAKAAADFGRSVGATRSSKREVDLKSILGAETDRRLAQPLLLKTVQLRKPTDDIRIVVDFVSYTGLRGSVVLDEHCHPVSMSRISGEGQR